MAAANRKKSTLERKAIALVTKDVLDEERVTVFSIDDVEYTVPARPRPNISLKFMRNLREHGDNYAMAELMEDMLGTEGWNALCEFDGLTEDDLTNIMDLIQEIAMGSTESATKN